MDADQYFSQSKGKKKHMRFSLKLIPLPPLPTLMCEWQIHMLREESRKKN